MVQPLQSAPLLLALAATLSPGPARADRVTPGEITTWGHPSGQRDTLVRGLAYDGRHYYVADSSDHFIDQRPRDNTGRIYIYDTDGRLVKRLPEVPPARGVYFPHGVATDGVRLWTSDYFGGHLYEYEITTGRLLRSFPSPIAQPIRMDFQASTQTLWLTGYGNPRVYQVKLDGQVKSSFATTGFGPNISPALDGRGGLWLSDVLSEVPAARLERRSREGEALQAGYREPGWYSVATNINDRAAGYVRDIAPVYEADRGRWLVRFQKVRVDTLGGRLAGINLPQVDCQNIDTGQRVAARVASPELWNCEDAGLQVEPGQAVRVEIGGTALP